MHEDWKQTAHFSAEFCCQGRGVQRTREQESCSALRGRNNFRFPVGMVALAWDPKLTESLLAQCPRGEKADLEPKVVQAESRSHDSDSHWEVKGDPRLIGTNTKDPTSAKGPSWFYLTIPLRKRQPDCVSSRLSKDPCVSCFCVNGLPCLPSPAGSLRAR